MSENNIIISYINGQDLRQIHLIMSNMITVNTNSIIRTYEM